jgi:hypothetical protein
MEKLSKYLVLDLLTQITRFKVSEYFIVSGLSSNKYRGEF